MKNTESLSALSPTPTRSHAHSSLDARFAALADPTRRALLTQLTRGEATVMELAAPFSISQPAISRHLKVLEAAGLIERRVDGARRPCRLSLDGLRAMNEWLAMLGQAMVCNYGRLDSLLVELTTPQSPPPDPDHE